MKFEIEKGVFSEALSTAAHAVPNKSTLQILNNFLIHLEGNVLEISATDMDLGVNLKLEVNGLEDGKVVVNAKKLQEVIKNLANMPLTFTVEDYQVSIQSGSYAANLTGFDAMEFPSLPTLSATQTFGISSSELSFLSEKTLFAVSNDITRMALNGVYLEHAENKISLIATDGHRLGKAEIELEGPSWETGIIIPPKPLSFALRAVKPDTELEIAINDSHICISTDTLQIFSKLIEGPYPKYQSVIPQQFEKTAIAPREDLIAVVNRVATMANARTRQIKVSFQSGSAEISTRNQDIGGKSQENVSLQYEGEPNFPISFNASFLSDILKMCPSDQVVFKMNTSVGACVIEPQGEGLDFFFLIMPLRLTEES